MEPSNYSRCWQHLYSPKHNLLFVRMSVGFLVHRWTQYNFDNNPMDFCPILPTNAVPVSTRQTQHTWIVPRRVMAQELPSETTMSMNFSDILHSLDMWEKDLLNELPFILPKVWAWEALCGGTRCYAASNGSAPKDQDPLAGS